MHIKGGTGPLVYPAGHVWVYRALHWATGGAIPPAQRIFIVLYLLMQAVAMRLYIEACVAPPWALALLCLSKRLHSIFMLRLFNDGIATMVAYLATLALVHRKWALAVVLYSAGVSIKMHVLLMAPPVLAVLLQVAAAVGMCRQKQELLCITVIRVRRRNPQRPGSWGGCSCRHLSQPPFWLPPRGATHPGPLSFRGCFCTRGPST